MKIIRTHNIPYVSVPLVSYLLLNEKDVMTKVLEGKAPERMVSNIDTLKELENKGIIKPQRVFEAPRFNDSGLTNDSYEHIVDEVKKSTKISELEKKNYLDKLARDNYKTSFRGTDSVEPESDGFFAKLTTKWEQFKEKWE